MYDAWGLCMMRSESSNYKLGRLDKDCLFWNLCWDRPTNRPTNQPTDQPRYRLQDGSWPNHKNPHMSHLWTCPNTQFTSLDLPLLSLVLDPLTPLLIHFLHFILLPFFQVCFSQFIPIPLLNVQLCPPLLFFLSLVAFSDLKLITDVLLPSLIISTSFPCWYWTVFVPSI